MTGVGMAPTTKHHIPFLLGMVVAGGGGWGGSGGFLVSQEGA
jgi:hypothetical protein